MDDWYKMRMLLDIIHMAASAGPAYAWIVTAADTELQKMQPPPPVIKGDASQPLPSPATLISTPFTNPDPLNLECRRPPINADNGAEVS